MDILPAGKMVSSMLPFNTPRASNPSRRLTLLQSLLTNVVVRRVSQWLVQLACANLGVPVLLDYSTHRDRHITFESRKLHSSEWWQNSKRRSQDFLQPGNSLAHPTRSSLKLWQQRSSDYLESHVENWQTPPVYQ